MRTFIDGTGADSTAAVKAYLPTHRQLEIADLYVITTAPNYRGQFLGRTFLVSDYPSPLLWSHKGTFAPGVISRSGVESKIGLEADTLDVTWSPSADTLAGSIAILEAFNVGIFDNGSVELWRCLMPATGDCDTLGACLMFAGRIGDVEMTRASVKFTVNSLLETLNEQVPTNIIEPTNILAQYSVGTVPEGYPEGFTVLAGSTRSKIYAASVSAPPTPREPQSVSLTVEGTSQPWLFSLNQSLDFGNHTGTAPTVVAVTVQQGDEVTITADPDWTVAASDSRDWFNAAGDPGFITADMKTDDGKYYYPSHFMADKDLGLCGLCGAFTNDAGNVVGSPLSIGLDGTFTVPKHATKLQLGTNDDSHVDNRGRFSVTVDVTPGVATGVYAAGYLIVRTGNLAGTYRAIYSQAFEGDDIVFYLYEPLPFDIAEGDTFTPYIPTPRDYLSSDEFAGFPFVPQPINSAVIL